MVPPAALAVAGGAAVVVAARSPAVAPLAPSSAAATADTNAPDANIIAAGKRRVSSAALSAMLADPEVTTPVSLSLTAAPLTVGVVYPTTTDAVQSRARAEVLSVMQSAMAKTERNAQSLSRDAHDKGFAVAVDAANKYAGALGVSGAVDGASEALGRHAINVMWANRNTLAVSGGCGKVAPIVAAFLVAGPPGVTFVAPTVAPGAPAAPGAIQVGGQIFEAARTGDWTAVTITAAKAAAQQFGQLVGWACSLAAKFGADAVAKVVAKFAGPVLKVALRLYRSSGAAYVVGKLGSWTRVGWQECAQGIHAATGLAGDALDLIGADDAWEAVTDLFGGIPGSGAAKKAYHKLNPFD